MVDSGSVDGITTMTRPEDVYPTAGTGGLPSVTYTENPHASYVHSQTQTVAEPEKYHDDQIIPWRKLYARSRQEETSLKESFQQPVVRFLIDYNQWPIIVLSSIILSLFTIPMDWTITWLNNLKYGVCKTGIFTVRESCAVSDWKFIGDNVPVGVSFLLKLSVMLAITITFACVGLKISRTNQWIAKSGISELKLIISGHVNNEFLKPMVIVRKYIALLFICASGGLLIGYEGPLIHISCGVINILIDLFSSNIKFFENLNNAAIRREMISIGFVIGISLAFGSPIGGLLFSIENLKLGTRFNTLMWNGFVCASIATFIFFKFHPFRKILINEAFTVEIGNGWIFLEAVPYLFVGWICGLLSLVYNKLHLQIITFRKNSLPQFLANPYVEIIALSALTQLLHYPLNFDYLTLNNMLTSLFYDCSSTTESYYRAVCESSNQAFELTYYLVIIFVQSSYSYSLDIPGGILLPSLIIGAIIGRLIGEFVELIQHKFGATLFEQCFLENKKCVSPGSYAIVGAASFFAGVTNTSVAAVVIVFEVTGAVTYLIPLMLGVVVAKTTVDVFDSKGFYELWLEKMSKHYLSSEITDSLKLAHLSEITIGNVIRDQTLPVCIDDDVTVGDLKKLIGKGSGTNDGIVLVDKSDCVVGWISCVDVLNDVDGHDDSKYITFTALNNDRVNWEIVQLHKHIVSIEDLFVVNSEYTLLSAYSLMTEMLVTNVIVVGDGYKYKGVLKISELSEMVKK